MDPDDCLRVLLELDERAGDALSGRIGTEGRFLEFSGWLGLLAALERTRQSAGGARSPPAEPHRTALDDRSKRFEPSSQEVEANQQEGSNK